MLPYFQDPFVFFIILRNTTLKSYTMYYLNYKQGSGIAFYVNYKHSRKYVCRANGKAP